MSPLVASFALLAVMGAVSAPAQDIVSGDHLQNSGFETWTTPPAAMGKASPAPAVPAPWLVGADSASSTGSVTMDTAVKHGGQASARIHSATATDGTKLAQIIAIPPNCRFHLQCWLRGEEIVSDPPGKGGAAIWINLGPQADFYAHQSHVTTSPNPKDGTFDWQLVQFDGKTNDDTAKVNIVVQLRMATGTLWVDDAALTVTQTPGAQVAASTPAATPSQPAVPTPPPKPKPPTPAWATAPVVPVPAVGLAHVWSTLAATKKLNIAYLGGSVTAGTGASQPQQTSWRALTTAWFQAQFPQARITEINATIGGTGCDLGACRLESEILSKAPDLLFVEFAVNDGGPPARHTEAMEGIVRHVRRTNPDCCVVFVYVADRGMIAHYNKNLPPGVAVFTEQRVADFYGVPTVNAGKALADQIATGSLTIDAAYKDNVHPADPGHASYAKTVTDFLASHEGDKPAPVPSLGPPLSPAPWENAGLVDASGIDAPGWTKAPSSMAGRYPHMLTCNTPGTELVYHFSGTFVGLYWLVSADGGNVEWSVDGGESGVVAARDRYTTSGNRPSYIFLADSLPPGKHTLHLKIASDSPPGSNDHWVRIGAFLAAH